MLFPGELAFRLKDQHGFPLDLTVDIAKERGMRVNWREFIDSARRAGWWDYQTLKHIEYAQTENGQNVMEMARAYVVANPHPAL